MSERKQSKKKTFKKQEVSIPPSPAIGDFGASHTTKETEKPRQYLEQGEGLIINGGGIVNSFDY